MLVCLMAWPKRCNLYGSQFWLQIQVGWLSPVRLQLCILVRVCRVIVACFYHGFTDYLSEVSTTRHTV